ncbi:MAG: phosphoglucosamine mutase [Mariprofundales bacterium]
MIRKYFGTDGVRGRVNETPMTAEFALALGRAAGFILTNHLSHKPHILIGKDTRLSGYMIESALCAGLTAQGMNVLLVGPVPTPAVSYLTRSLRADAGIMLSASHNPAGDNGIKFFGADGFKLPDAVEYDIESCLENLPPLPAAENVGKANRIDDAAGRYIEFCKTSLPRGLRLDGIKVVIDCANGAAYQIAPDILNELGCDVVSLHNCPDGYNINKQCGSTDTNSLQKAVLATDADVGFALDGDADRLIACDAQGCIVDGDKVLAILAEHLHAKSELSGNAVVTTLMSNMGLERFLQARGINMPRTDVGDRYVLEEMRRIGSNLGGEQSGHIILLDHNTTGDGIMTALRLLCAMVDNKNKKIIPLADMAGDLVIFPQRLWNICLKKRSSILDNTEVQTIINQANKLMADRGRINIRMSGTEPKLRVMVEAEDAQLMQQTGDNIVAKLRNILRSQLANTN